MTEEQTFEKNGSAINDERSEELGCAPEASRCEPGAKRQESICDTSGFKLIDKEDVMPKKSKRNKEKKKKFSFMKEKAEKLAIIIHEKIDISRDGRISDKARAIAKWLEMENKSDSAIYSGLRYLLFHEGIILGITSNNKDSANYFTFRKASFDSLPKIYIENLDERDIDGWQIKRNYNHLKSMHSIKKDKDFYILESEGDIYFDRRSLTEEQALQFIKYMYSRDLHVPDFLCNTPINILLNQNFLNVQDSYFDNIIADDLEKIGYEFRITRSGDVEFTILSIYGKECTVYEHDIDRLIKECSIRSILDNFDNALIIEKIPERIALLQKIIPEIKTKNMAMIEKNKVVIVNKEGTFNLSLTDGTLHKLYNSTSRYICVGPVRDKRNFIIYDGVRHEIDRITGAILSKTTMLLEEKYPDKMTEIQVKN